VWFNGCVARLGELLIDEKLITAPQLEEALETQVVHGGRVGTNLVELGFLKEVDLARVLGRLHNLPYASGDMIPDPAALAISEARFYDDQDLLPMRVDATRLTVVVLGPAPIAALDTLGFKAGKRVVAVVIPEFRMNQLLRKFCKAFRPIRPIDMNTLRPSTRRGDDQPQPVAATELINEDDFAKIYAEAMVDEEAPVAAARVEELPLITGEVVAEAQLPALTFPQAQAELQKVTGRDEIARVVLQFARSKFKRALLLSVQGDLVSGWQGLGQGVQPRAVLRIGVSLREQNTFKLVRDLRSHFIGPMRRTPGMAVFYQLLGGGYPTTAVVLPLLVRGKPVHLLYVDEGPNQLTPPDIGELLILSQSVTRSYEALIRKRQAARAN
jgi:Type II secretion system (T2SS), protein E, N-terminal domain